MKLNTWVFWPMMMVGVVGGVHLMAESNPLKMKETVRVTVGEEGIWIENVSRDFIENAHMVINSTYAANVQELAPGESRLADFADFRPFRHDRAQGFSGVVLRIEVETRADDYAVNQWTVLVE